MNKNLFRAELSKKGMTQGQLAKKLGMAPSTVYRKIKKDTFGADEIKSIMAILDIADPVSIFFGDEVT